MSIRGPIFHYNTSGSSLQAVSTTQHSTTPNFPMTLVTVLLVSRDGQNPPDNTTLSVPVQIVIAVGGCFVLSAQSPCRIHIFYRDSFCSDSRHYVSKLRVSASSNLLRNVHDRHSNQNILALDL